MVALVPLGRRKDVEGDGGGKKMDKKVYTYCAPLSPVSSKEKNLNIGRLFHQQVIADDGEQLAKKRQSSCDMNVCVGIVHVIASSVYTLARKDNRRSSVGHRAYRHTCTSLYLIASLPSKVQAGTSIFNLSPPTGSSSHPRTHQHQSDRIQFNPTRN